MAAADTLIGKFLNRELEQISCRHVQDPLLFVRWIRFAQVKLCRLGSISRSLLLCTLPVLLRLKPKLIGAVDLPAADLDPELCGEEGRNVCVTVVLSMCLQGKIASLSGCRRALVRCDWTVVRSVLVLWWLKSAA
jgi:hypothetical protein